MTSATTLGPPLATASCAVELMDGPISHIQLLTYALTSCHSIPVCPVWRLQQQRPGCHRQLHIVRGGQVDDTHWPRAAASSWLRRTGARALLRTCGEVPTGEAVVKRSMACMCGAMCKTSLALSLTHTSSSPHPLPLFFPPSVCPSIPNSRPPSRPHSW